MGSGSTRTGTKEDVAGFLFPLFTPSNYHSPSNYHCTLCLEKRSRSRTQKMTNFDFLILSWNGGDVFAFFVDFVWSMTSSRCSRWRHSLHDLGMNERCHLLLAFCTLLVVWRRVRGLVYESRNVGVEVRLGL